MLHVSHACVLFLNSCTYQSMQSYPIITSNLYFLVSHHTVAALFIPPHRKKSHLSQFWPALSFGPLPVGPLICTEWNSLLWRWGLAARMLMPECRGIGLDSGTFARHWDYRCDDVKKKKSMKDTKAKQRCSKKSLRFNRGMRSEPLLAFYNHRSYPRHAPAMSQQRHFVIQPWVARVKKVNHRPHTKEKRTIHPYAQILFLAALWIHVSSYHFM